MRSLGIVSVLSLTHESWLGFRMRDLTARTNNENTELKKQLELLQEECDAVTANSERLQRELAQAAEAINTFREQVAS